MALSRQKFQGSDTPVQIAGINTDLSETVAADTSTTAFTADRLVQLQDVDGTGFWFLIGDEGDTLTPAADTGAYVPASGSTDVFVLPRGKVVEANAKINLIVREDA